MNVIRANSIFTHVVILSLFCTSILFHKDISGLLQANSIAMLKHDPVKNMVYPYQKTVDWSKSLSSTSLSFNNINPNLFIDPIKYDPNKLGPVENLEDLSDDVLNARLTYSVPYLGNYKYDGKEYVGSHPGVDIKLPKGAPILSIANGVVTKAVTSDIGFGNHIVIRHNNVFNPELNTYEDIYSSYAHLSQMNVNVGDVVQVGQTIGLSGSTGLSSGSHLNFQIEKTSAPYHPYWPFSDKEIYAAGLNFVSGVNQAYGYNNALTHTYNPLVYIDSLFLDTFIASSDKTESLESSEPNTSSQSENLGTKIKTQEAAIINKPSISEYIMASLALDITDQKQSDIVTTQVNQDLKSVHEVSSLNIENENKFLWDIPPIIKPAKNYEFKIHLGSYNLEDISFKSNKAVNIELIESNASTHVFSLQTNSIGSIKLELFNNHELIASKNIDSIVHNIVATEDLDYEKIKLLSIMGLLNNSQVDLSANITRYDAIRQLSKVFDHHKIQTSKVSYDTKFVDNNEFNNNVIRSAFEFHLLKESDIISLNTKIDFGEFFEKYYQALDLYVSPLPKLPFKSSIRPFGKNKLYVQQALIDGLVEVDQIKTRELTNRDLIQITYNLIVKK